MRYSAEYSREAENYLRRASAGVRARILARVEQLCDDPFNPSLSKPLHGAFAGPRSSRVGEFRLMFEVSRERVLVTIVRIGPRGDVYSR